MKITISDKKKISAVQKEFSEMFPYLKIEFFSKPHKTGAPSSKKIMKQPSKTLGECRAVHTSGTITITPQISVAELEQKLLDMFGLSAQVFRKSGKAWLETTVTDGWTLDKQNKQGEALSDYLMKNGSTGDYVAAE